MTHHKGSVRSKLKNMTVGETIWLQASSANQRSPVRYDESLKTLGDFTFDKFTAIKNQEIHWVWRVVRMK